MYYLHTVIGNKDLSWRPVSFRKRFNFQRAYIFSL